MRELLGGPVDLGAQALGSEDGVVVQHGAVCEREGEQAAEPPDGRVVSPQPRRLRPQQRAAVRLVQKTLTILRLHSGGGTASKGRGPWPEGSNTGVMRFIAGRQGAESMGVESMGAASRSKFLSAA